MSDTPNDDYPEARDLRRIVAALGAHAIGSLVRRLRTERYHRAVVQWDTWESGERVTVRVEVFRH